MKELHGTPGITRRAFTGAIAAGSVIRGFAQTQQRKPNIIFVLADDLGYGDLGCYGQRFFATPNLDAMAKDGMRFTQSYCGSTVCAPSRSTLMEGLHTGHARIRGNTRVDLKPDDLTVAELLKSAGYRTGIVGKWGLGTAGGTGVPNRKGFDEFYGFLDQKHAHTQYPTQIWENDKESFLDGNFGPNRKDYAHDVFTRRGLEFIDRNRAQPFFLYLAYTVPHANNELTRLTGNGMEVPDFGPYAKSDWPEPDKGYAAMVHRLDADIGRLMAQLEKHGIARNTALFFSSDNGPHREGGNEPDRFKSSGPFRGIKRGLYDGGIRVPTIVRWPERVAAGQVSDEICAFWDFLPTAAEIAGVKIPSGRDGISIMPALAGKPLPKREFLYWEFHEGGFSQAIRMGEWKAVRNRSVDAPIELYRITTDPGESKNVAGENAAVVARARDIFKQARVESTEFPAKSAAPA